MKHEVSCNAVHAALLALSRKRIDEALLVEGLPVTLKYLKSMRNWISWELFVELMRRYESLAGSDAELAIAEAYLEDSGGNSNLSLLKAVASIAIDPYWIYRFGVRFVGPFVFPQVVPKLEALSDREFLVTLQIPDHLEDSPFFLRTTRHTFEIMLVPITGMRAEVTMELRPRRGIYRIALPLPKSFRPGARSSMEDVASSLPFIAADVTRRFEDLKSVLKDLNRLQDETAGLKMRRKRGSARQRASDVRGKDYRAWLVAEFESRKDRNPKYSIRAFARKLGLSPSALSNVLNGRRGLSVEMAAEISSKLDFTTEETRRFCRMVENES